MAKAIRLLKKGAQLVRNKEWSQAADVFLQATEKAPKDPRCWFGLGISLFKVRNFDVARMALERARVMGHPKADKVLTWVDRAEEQQGAEAAKAAARPSPKAAAPAGAGVSGEDVPLPTEETEPEEREIDLGRKLLVMLIEPVQKHRQSIQKSIEENIKHACVETATYDISSADTLSGKVYHDVAILDWDADPSAAAGAVQIFKLKRPHMQILCLTENWHPQKSCRILKAGADYHLVKQKDFARTIPLVIGQLAHRDEAVLKQHGGGMEGAAGWSGCLDAVGDRMLFVGMDFSILRANKAALQTWAARSGRLQGQRYPGVLYGRHEPPESCPLYRALDSQKLARGEVPAPDTDETFGVRAWPVFNDAGDVQGAVAIIGDRPAGGAGEGADSDGVAGASLDHLQCGVVALDDDGAITWVNGMASDLMCSDRESLLGVDYLAMLSNGLEDVMEDPEGFLRQVEKAHRSGEDLKGIEMPLGNSEHRETLSYWSTRTESGDPAVARIEHYYPAPEGVAQAGRPPQRGPELVEQIASATADVIFTAEPNGKITWTSNGASEAGGLSARRLQGKSLQDLALPQEREKVQQLLRQSMQNGSRPSRQEIAIAPDGGTRRWAEIILLPAIGKEAEGQPLRGVLRDITEKKLNQAIREILSGARSPEEAG